MDGEGRARRCGGNRAGAIVGRGHRFRARARRLKTSGEAGRVTASFVDPHSGDGWFVLHDVAVPGAEESIDHLVVTPTGVFVVEALEWSGEVSQAGGALRMGRGLPRRRVDALRLAVRSVADVLVSVFPDLDLRPEGVISLTGCPPAQEAVRAGGITAVPAGRLVRHLSKGPPVSGPERVEQLAVALDEALESCSGRSSSLVRPFPLSAPGPTASTIAGPGSASVGPDVAPVAGRRPSGPGGGEAWRTGGSSLRNVMRPLLAVVGVVLFFYFFATWSRALPRVTTGGSGTPSAWAPTGASATLRSAWSCPTGNKGWTASLAWPAGAPPGPWVAEVSASAFGPWTIKEAAAGSPEPTLTGLLPGSRQWVQVGTRYGLINTDPIMKGLLVVPDGC